MLYGSHLSIIIFYLRKKLKILLDLTLKRILYSESVTLIYLNKIKFCVRVAMIGSIRLIKIHPITYTAEVDRILMMKEYSTRHILFDLPLIMTSSRVLTMQIARRTGLNRTCTSKNARSIARVSGNKICK